MHSPTLTAAHGTQLGVILGTAAYMAPEQARGTAVDARADIWAFGVVLYEMLAGGTLFASDTVPDTLAAVLTREVDWSRLPAATPPAILQLLRRCLERRPKERLHSIADARQLLADLASGRVAGVGGASLVSGALAAAPDAAAPPSAERSFVSCPGQSPRWRFSRRRSWHCARRRQRPARRLGTRSGSRR